MYVIMIIVPISFATWSLIYFIKVLKFYKEDKKEMKRRYDESIRECKDISEYYKIKKNIHLP